MGFDSIERLVNHFGVKRAQFVNRFLGTALSNEQIDESDDRSRIERAAKFVMAQQRLFGLTQRTLPQLRQHDQAQHLILAREVALFERTPPSDVQDPVDRGEFVCAKQNSTGHGLHHLARQLTGDRLFGIDDGTQHPRDRLGRQRGIGLKVVNAQERGRHFRHVGRGVGLRQELLNLGHAVTTLARQVREQRQSHFEFQLQ